jgi:hypothetical protein
MIKANINKQEVFFIKNSPDLNWKCGWQERFCHLESLTECKSDSIQEHLDQVLGAAVRRIWGRM